ncbi:MAG: hypothetical protein GYB21_01350, partial [Oceanospirillales bacterium]|nr:hypothetical protein [Oceanospirillales bacterium]
MTHRFKLFTLFPALLFALVISLPAQARLDPEPVYKQTLLEVVDTLQRGHYNRISINDD